MMKSTAVALMCLGLVSCSPKEADHAGAGAAESPAASISEQEASAMMSNMPSSSVDIADFAGRWIGPEGTSLVIAREGSGASVIITNLDRPRTFAGTLVADGVRLERDGKRLLIHKGNGADTGMKWLAEKSDCLVVDDNEGYCRD